MRVVAGKHRGRRLEVPAGTSVRPTSDRVREALFNVLEHGGFGPGGVSPLAGARVLDAFCGSGALGLEALSRGAAHLTLMDNETIALDTARRNVETIGETARVTVRRADVTNPPPAAEPCDVVFLDPPYERDLAGPALAALADAGWLAPDALCVVEISAKSEAEPPPGFTLLDDRTYGAARLWFLRRAAD